VDTISCATGKQDRRIGNPGLNRAFLGYGQPESPGLGRIRDNAITLKKSTENPGPKQPWITPFSPQNKSVSVKSKSVSGFAMPKPTGFTPVNRSGRPSVFGLVCAEDNWGDGLLHMAKNEGLFSEVSDPAGDLWGDTLSRTRFSDGDVRGGMARPGQNTHSFMQN